MLIWEQRVGGSNPSAPTTFHETIPGRIRGHRVQSAGVESGPPPLARVLSIASRPDGPSLASGHRASAAVAASTPAEIPSARSPDFQPARIVATIPVVVIPMVRRTRRRLDAAQCVWQAREWPLGHVAI